MMIDNMTIVFTLFGLFMVGAMLIVVWRTWAPKPIIHVQVDGPQPDVDKWQKGFKVDGYNVVVTNKKVDVTA